MSYKHYKCNFLSYKLIKLFFCVTVPLTSLIVPKSTLNMLVEMKQVWFITVGFLPLPATAVWGIIETCPDKVEVPNEENLPSWMVYVHKNQCQLFHMSNVIIWLTNWISLVHLNSFRSINSLFTLFASALKHTLHKKTTL